MNETGNIEVGINGIVEVLWVKLFYKNNQHQKHL
jgi:hypothetical protein